MKKTFTRICLHCGASTTKNRLTCSNICLSAYRAELARKTIAIATLHSCTNCKKVFLGRRKTCSDTCLATIRRQKALLTIARGPRCMSCKKWLSKSLDRKTCNQKCYELFRRRLFSKNLHGVSAFLKNAAKIDKDRFLARRLQEQRQPVGSLLNAVAFEIIC